MLSDSARKSLSRLTFTEDDHCYTLDKGTENETVLASATQMISGLRLTDTSFFRPHHLQAGTDRHVATELWDRGILDEGSLDENTGPALEAWKKFLDHSGFEVEEIEIRCFSEKHLYAGTIDRIGVLDGKRTILDIKGSAEMPTYALQLFLYKIAWQEITGDKIEDLVSVHLLKSGKYKAHSHADKKSALVPAMAVPTLHRWNTGEEIWSKATRIAARALCEFSESYLEE